VARYGCSGWWQKSRCAGINPAYGRQAAAAKSQRRAKKRARDENRNRSSDGRLKVAATRDEEEMQIA